MASPDQRNRFSKWSVVAIVWVGLALMDATQAVLTSRAEGLHYAWKRLFFVSLLPWIPWAFATPGIMRLNGRYSVTEWRVWRTWVVHLSAILLCDVALAVLFTVFERLLNPFAQPTPLPPFGSLFVENFLSGSVASIVLYAGILSVDTALGFRANFARQQVETATLTEQLLRAELDALRRQIEPHFLFNTLNSISGLIREGRGNDAVGMIAGLSDFMRRSLAGPARHEVPLGEEMEFAQKYLDIQKVRFIDRLNFTIDVPSDLLTAQVPAFFLQLMVENAIKHGIAKRAEGGLIRISASRNNGVLTVSVYNDGPALAMTEPTGSGIGLTNMRTRLQGLYGKEFSLHLHNQHPHGVEACVSVPFIKR